MKIAIFHNLPSGGAKRYLFEVVKRIPKKHKIDLYRLSGSSKYLNLKKYTENQYTYQYYSGKNILTFVLKAIFLLPKIHKRIAKKINENNYDILIANHDYVTKSPYILRYVTCPKIYFCHESQREYYEDTKYHAPLLKDKIVNLIRVPIRWIDVLNIKKVDSIMCTSLFEKKELERIYKKKIIMVYPGVDFKKFKNIKLKRKNQVLSVGSLLPFKGHEKTIKSLGLIKETKRPLLVIVGDGRMSEKRKIKSLAKKNKVKIKIKNKISEKTLLKIYNESKLYISCAHKEPFGLTILEAMACETPAVVVNGGGPSEQVVDGVTGYIVSSNEKEISKKIIMAIKNYKKLGKKSRLHVCKKWDWLKTSKKIINILKSLK